MDSNVVLQGNPSNHNNHNLTAQASGEADTHDLVGSGGCLYLRYLQTRQAQ